MLIWALVNLGLSLLALAFVACNGTAPHRVRFLALFIALVAWLVPWPLMPDLIPSGFSLQLGRVERDLEVQSSLYTGFPLVVVQSGTMPLAPRLIVLSVIDLVFAALCGIGLVLFLWNVASQHYRLRRLARQGSDGSWVWRQAGLDVLAPVTIQRDIGGAFTSGLWRPRIWLHGDLCSSPELETVLRHELTHIHQHDNWYLGAITFAEKLFWWNPLVWWLGREARELQELSCDESCRHAMPDYPTRLAHLMLESARDKQRHAVLALSANIFNKPNPNVRRIQLLQRSYAMKTRHIVSAIATAVSAVFTVGFVTAQPEPAFEAGQRVLITRQLMTDPGNPEETVVIAGDYARPAGDEDLLFTRVVGVEGEGEVSIGAAGPVRMLHADFVSGAASSDQFVKIEGSGEDMLVSFSFTNAPLPMVLAPLADMSAGPMPPPPGIVPVAGEAGVAFAMPATRAIVLRDPPAGATVAAEPHFVPLSPNLTVLDESAAGKLVSVSAEQVTLDEALELVADASGCAVFLDGDSIAVDDCED